MLGRLTVLPCRKTELLGNKSPDSNRFTLVTPKPENGVRLQATLGNQNPTGLPVGAVRIMHR